MVAKIILFIVIFPLSIIVNSQNFKLLGDRCFESNGTWDTPDPIAIHQDNNDLYIYVDEASQPRNPELIKLQLESQIWNDLSQSNYNVASTSITKGVIMEDGTVYAGIRSFDNNYYAYKFFVDGSWEDFGVNPIPNVPPDSFGLDVVVSEIGELYFFGGFEASFVSKWNGDSWVSLPNFDNNLTAILEIDAAINEDENLFVAYEDSGKVKVKVLPSGASQWTDILTNTFDSSYPRIFVVSEQEIYLSYSVLSSNGSDFAFMVLKYDGLQWQPMGDEIINNYCSSADIIKLSSGGLYISNCESIFVYNEIDNVWTKLENDIVDSGVIASFNDLFYESNSGTLINVLGWLGGEDCSGITAIEYTPENLSTNQNQVEKFDLFPNPTQNELHISNSDKINKIEIYDLSGKLVWRKTYESKQTDGLKIDVSEYSRGVYLLKINEEKTYKFIKE